MLGVLYSGMYMGNLRVNLLSIFIGVVYGSHSNIIWSSKAHCLPFANQHISLSLIALVSIAAVGKPRGPSCALKETRTSILKNHHLNITQGYSMHI